MFNKRKALNPSRKLNEIKIKMAYLEWYKKRCKAKEIGYYDSYKNHLSESDRDVTKYKKFLTNYWKDLVEEAEKKPQKEGKFIQLTWLFAGTNYRRMVEPLEIAEYYRTHGNRNYEALRSEHYRLLEKWQKEDADRPTGPPSNKKKKEVAGALTEDSCFWAKVEEAIISCELWMAPTSSALEKQSSRECLIDFEKYVMEQIKNYAVSPEIFLRESSFMKWWGMYQNTASNRSLIDFMRNSRNVQYEKGRLFYLVYADIGKILMKWNFI
ncbi:hypothetical protein GH714_011037 [Hevea brasiliensis]|uniref:EDS1 EP domain-containing protein n=1 Tax=Hevea brasiliensis TaxID=3981 RepID=A0A6A6M7V3_HEVBR|nr:hypothetical protein GH714_011037 [Hevea brasiliensis]